MAATSGQPIVQRCRSVRRLRGGSADITELEEHRQQLVQANELYHSVVEAGPAVARLDKRGRIIYMNSRWDEVLENPEGQLRGVHWLRILNAEQQRRDDRPWPRVGGDG